MAALDGVLEGILALGGLVLAANVAFVVLASLYAVFVVGGTALGTLVALLFAVIGAVIVLGFLQLYLGGRSTTAAA